VQVGAEWSLETAGGDFDFGRSSATLRAIITPRSLIAVAVEGAAGTSTGTVPIQSRFYLGGPATLRGYDGAVIAGDSYWRGRLEVGTTFPAARLTGFSDIGWAGPRSDFGNGRPLIGAGIGASFIDGLVLMDLSRALRAPTGWRFDLYFDGRL
jgi:hemolysin activation/secretion protein